MKTTHRHSTAGHGVAYVILFACAMAALPLRAQSIDASPDSGTADAGLASRPIADVAANDTVNGAQATLGASGNATISKVGTWPAGIALNLATGAVSTTTAVAAGSYDFVYQLCDLNSPPNCVSATDTVTVVDSSIVATPDSGTADAGIASRPIANVAANDTVNGAAAVLGTSGNATVAQVGTWPAGVALTPSTGAVSTTVSVPAGSYSVQYHVCDRNTPANCSTAADSITVITSSVVAAPDSGMADAGIASRPIANVAANDTVNGAAAVLGTSGNATVAQVGTWPAGVALTPSTGAVSTTTAVPAGSYNVQYHVCDRNTPANCNTATDSVTVITPSIKPVADSGSAAFGTAATPIANVAANDMVDGAAAVLGTSGNGSVAQVGTWPAGITLNTATGAVSTTASVAAGSYSFQYRLCDKNAPADCATTTDSVSVINSASVAAVPEYGSVVVGTVATPIANVAANDTVNGAAATLGASGNATVAQVGTWPVGITLNVATGAVTTSTSTVVGNYSFIYQICTKAAPGDCATATDAVSVAGAQAEVQVSPVALNDIEFDWGRDGIYCAACNFGQTNARFNWTDSSGNLWVGHVDPTTGNFTPPAGNNELVDTTAAFYSTFGNGPEWAFSTQGGQVISQLVYTRFAPGSPPTTATAEAAFATPASGGWTLAFFPGANMNGSGGAITTIDPEASQCNADTLALTEFSDLSTPQSVYWELTTSAPGTAPNLTPFGPYASTISGGKPSVRWVPCTRQMVFVGSAPPDGSGNVYQQVFWYDIDSQVVQQLTFDPREHSEAFMFQAPEFDDNYVLVTVADNLTMEIYEQSAVGGNGAPTFQLVNQINSPDPAEPYVIGTEPFIDCTPACQSYVFTKVESVLSNRTNLASVPNGLAVTNINPASPMFKILVPQEPTPKIQRMDLEYYITVNGAYLYYDRNVISSSTTQFQPQGRYYVDMQLGVPSGPCVGSSAEAGMVQGC